MHLDGRHVVFGRVVEGMASVNQIQRSPCDPSRGHIIQSDTEVLITECGELLSLEQEMARRDDQEFAKLNPEFMIRDREEQYPSEREEPQTTSISRATWAMLSDPNGSPVLDCGTDMLGVPPQVATTKADVASASAEIGLDEED